MKLSSQVETVNNRGDQTRPHYVVLVNEKNQKLYAAKHKAESLFTSGLFNFFPKRYTLL